MQVVSINVEKSLKEMQNFKRKVQTAPTYTSSVINKHFIDTHITKKLTKTYCNVTMYNLNLFRSFLAVFWQSHRDTEAKTFKLYTRKALVSLVLSKFKVK